MNKGTTKESPQREAPPAAQANPMGLMCPTWEDETAFMVALTRSLFRTKHWGLGYRLGLKEQSEMMITLLLRRSFPKAKGPQIMRAFL
jgi:hypothetical protein